MIKFLLLGFIFLSLTSTAQIDRKAFYNAFSSENATTLSNCKKQIQSATESADKRAFLGALQMKESQFEKTAKLKLDKFNQGKAALEAEIKKQGSNTEYRFLRLMIQENAPKLLKYSSNIATDASFIVSNFSKTTSVLRSTIIDYSKTSNSLKTAGFKVI